MLAIETNNLSKHYGNVVALEDLNLTVNRGEVYGFLGPNGAGKTTTIHLLLGFITPSSGQMSILGSDIRENAMDIRQNLGLLPEGASLYDRVTGREHVEFAAKSKGVDADVDALLDRVGLAPDDAARAAGNYSKGMTQRIRLAMALVGDPDLLILDEPSSGLDPTGMSEMRTLIQNEAESGTTVFFSSHILSEVEAVADRIGILKGGHLVVEDNIDSFREQEETAVVEFSVDESTVTNLSVEEFDGVIDARWDRPDRLVVVCSDPTEKAPVIRYVSERATVLDVISEETSLETMFERYVSTDALSHQDDTTGEEEISV